MLSQLKAGKIPFDSFITNLAKEIIQSWMKDLNEGEIDILEGKLIFLIKLTCKMCSYDQTINSNIDFINNQYKKLKEENQTKLKEYDYKINSNIEKLEKLDVREGEIRTLIDDFIEKKEDELKYRPTGVGKNNNVCYIY